MLGAPDQFNGVKAVHSPAWVYIFSGLHPLPPGWHWCSHFLCFLISPDCGQLIFWVGVEKKILIHTQYNLYVQFHQGKKYDLLTWANISVSVAVAILWILGHFESTFMWLVAYLLRKNDIKNFKQIWLSSISTAHNGTLASWSFILATSAHTQEKK